jgi:hypothetical protein
MPHTLAPKGAAWPSGITDVDTGTDTPKSAVMKIFWSWQSDTSGKTGRHFVREALMDAIKQLKVPS